MAFLSGFLSPTLKKLAAMLADSGADGRITYTLTSREEFHLPPASSLQLTSPEFQDRATGSMAPTIASLAMSNGGGPLGQIGAGRHLPPAFHQQDEPKRGGGPPSSIRTRTQITSMALNEDSIFVGTSEGAVFRFVKPSGDASKMSNILASTNEGGSNSHHNKKDAHNDAFQQQLLKRLQQHKPTAVFTAHRSEVGCMVCHPTQGMLITGGCDSLLRTWSLGDSSSQGANVRGNKGTGNIHDSALISGGVQHGTLKSSGSGSATGTVPYLLQTIAAHDAAVTCVVASTSYVISGSVDKSVRVWAEKRDALTASSWLEPRQVFVFDSWITALYTVRNSKGDSSSLGELLVGDGAGLLTAFTFNDMRGFEIGKQTPVCLSSSSASGDAAGITAIIPMPEINKVALLGYSSTLWLLNLFSCEVSQTVEHPDATSHRFAPRFVSAVLIPNADGEILLQDNKGLMYVFSSKGGVFTYSSSAFEGASGMCIYSRNAVSATTRGIASTSVGGSHHADELCACSVLLITDGGRRVSHVRLQKVQTNDVQVADSRVSSLIAIGSGSSRAHNNGSASRASTAFSTDTQLKLPDPDGSLSSQEMSMHRRAASSADDDIRALISVEGSQNAVSLWSAQLLRLNHTNVPGSEVTSVCYIHERHWAVLGHEDGSLTVWMIGTGSMLTFKGHDNTVSGIGMGYHRVVEGKAIPWSHFYTISYDGCLALWDFPAYTDTTTSAVHRCDIRIRASNSELLCAAYDTLKYLYIVGDSSGDVTLWSAEDLRPLLRLKSNTPSVPNRAHTAAVTSVVLDGNYAFTGGEDDRIVLWNTASGEALKEIDASGIVKKSTAIGVRDEVLSFEEVVALAVCPSGDLIACSRSHVLGRFSFDHNFRPVSFYMLKQEPLSMAVYDSSVYVGTEDGAIVVVPIVSMTPCGSLES